MSDKAPLMMVSTLLSIGILALVFSNWCRGWQILALETRVESIQQRLDQMNTRVQELGFRR